MAKKTKSEKIDDSKKTKTSAKKEDNSKKSGNSKKQKGASGNKVTRFFRDLRSEFKKVVWPTKKQVVNNTLVVLVTIIVFGAFLGLFDTVLFKALQWVVSKG
jgi:preprotein translocase subunit SecE